MYKEEINCDLAAAESIAIFFEEKDPANCVQEFLIQELTEQEGKKSGSWKLLWKFLVVIQIIIPQIVRDSN